MDQSTHNKIVSFFWAIADDVLRDLSRHRTKATPRFRRHHSPTRRLCDAAKQAFYNTSKFTFRDLKSRATRGAKRLL